MSLNVINTKTAKEMLIYVANQIIDSKPLLTEIDSKIGDGDHGIGMSGGLKKAKEKLMSYEESSNVYDVFSLTGKTMLMSMGGASGVIFGSLFLAGAKNVSPKEELNTRDVTEMFDKSLQAIKERGKAEVGDKTMVDALEPAVKAMKSYEDNNLLEMFKLAESAAQEGVENTKNYIAKYGRAKSLMERAIGYQDAGATSVWIIFKSMREFIEND
ncbi:dihydroxyacetone kinase subunit DhaL [Apibacter sp. HY039]|uniref:dihydroxyacetone kinase subunit DhaL n=1 Tax=Apibacter sp. HY039 TaxID=2501476 RepID=UPI000FEBAEFA|nr:dihydroxyacetone kinase subunit DhaL [Apibacter sp. HY039]